MFFHENLIFYLYYLAFLSSMCIFAHLFKFKKMETNISKRREYAAWGRKVGEQLLAQGLTVSAAESLTGGTIASMIAQIAGSSAYFKGSVTSYAVSVKEEVLGVDVNLEGVVSESTARQMATGVAALLRSDCAVATTGIAGPGGAEPGKPVGTVCIAALVKQPDNEADGVSKTRLESRTFCFDGDRESVILQSADAALSLLSEMLNKNPKKD